MNPTGNMGMGMGSRVMTTTNPFFGRKSAKDVDGIGNAKPVVNNKLGQLKALKMKIGK